ncbi:MAG: hypothetical protein ACI9Y8_001678 [Candidatus Omnitrophota bacterium]|jgi:hypothetical protein
MSNVTPHIITILTNLYTKYTQKRPNIQSFQLIQF